MKALGAAYLNELTKLRSRKKYIVFLIIGLAICIIWTLLGNLISRVVQNNMSMSIVLSPTPMGVLPLFLHVLLPFLIFMAVTDLFTVEASDNTMKALLILPVERWKLYLSKLFAVISYVALYLIEIFVVASVCQLLFGKGETVTTILAAAASYALILIPLFVLTCFASLISLLGKSGTLTMLLLIVAYLAMCVLPILIPATGPLLFTSYLGFYRLFIGAVPAMGRLINMLLIVLSSGAVFFFASSIIFDKKSY